MGAGPRLRRRSTARLEQSAGRDPSQSISGCLQTFTENSLLYPAFFISIVFITFSPRAVDVVKCHWSIFFIYDTLILTILHYITLHYITPDFAPCPVLPAGESVSGYAAA